MAKVYSPNKNYSGFTAGVKFVKGIGETNNPRCLAWFKEHGYAVEEDIPTPAAPIPASKVPAEKIPTPVEETAADETAAEETAAEEAPQKPAKAPKPKKKGGSK